MPIHSARRTCLWAQLFGVVINRDRPGDELVDTIAMADRTKCFGTLSMVDLALDGEHIEW